MAINLQNIGNTIKQFAPGVISSMIPGGNVINAGYNLLQSMTPKQQYIQNQVPNYLAPSYGVSANPSAVNPSTPYSGNLTMGSSGDAVRKLQSQLGINSDGIFGNQTSQAVKAFQSANGLVADGIVGPKTLAALAAKGGTSTNNPGATGSVVGAYTDSTGSTGSTGSNGSSTGTYSPPSTANYDKAYQDYIASLSPSSGVTSAQKAYNDFIAQRDQKLTQVGDQMSPLRFLTGRQNSIRQSAGIEANRLQGDIGIQQGAQESLQGANKARLDYERSLLDNATKSSQFEREQALRERELAQQGGFSLSEGEKRYDAQGNLIASGGAKTSTSGGTSSSGNLSPLAQAVQNGYVNIEQLTPTQRGQVAAELAQSGLPSGRQQALQTNLASVDALINNPNKNRVSGFIQGKLRLGNLDPNAQLAINQFNQIKGILSLENRQQLKGSGAISDFEFRVLSDAADALGRNLKDADFNTQLQKVRDVFAGKYKNIGGQTNSQQNSSNDDALLSQYGL